MKILRKIFTLIRKRKLDIEMTEEMRHHVELQTDLNVKAGMNPDEARYAALRQFGNVASIQERARERRGWSWLEDFAKDLRYAVRSLSKSPGFTATALLTLALGIGANTALFSVINSVLLRPLPFPNADRLTVIWETSAQQGIKRDGPSGPNLYDWREHSRLFQDLAGVELGTGTVTGLGDPRQIPAMRVTTNLFSVLNVHAALGRLFSPEDGNGGRQALVIISRDFWQRAFGGNPHIVGKTVMIDLISYQVIGVLERDFWLPFQSDLFVPWPDDELRFQRGRLAHDLGVIGRLKPEITVAQAEAELNVIHTHLRLAHPELEGWGVTVVPLQSVITEYIRRALIVLFCAVACVLLIACANVANLLLARALGRGREVAVRAALGATRGRLIQQFLTESLVLSLAAGALGTLLAFWGVTILSAVVPATIPIPDASADVMLRPFEIDGRVLTFSIVVSLFTGILFGLAPAMHALKTNVVEGLKNGSRATAGGGRRIREALLVTEIALAAVLLSGAGLMLKSFARLQHADPGFRASHLLTLEIELPTDSHYKTRPEQSAFFARALEQIGSLPDVTSAAVTSVLPLHSQDQRAQFLIENGPVLPANEHFQADFRQISPGYFQTMGVAFKRGRLLDRHDSAEIATPLVGLVDEAFVRRFFADDNPLGRHLLLGTTRLEIVGVVGDVKHAGADREARPTLYVSFLQSPAQRMNLVLRTAAPGTAIASAKRAVWSIDPDLPIYRIESMEDVMAEATSAPRLTLSLLGLFAIVALGLAAIGIYGVMAYSVRQRTVELGIRMALGAGRGDILRQVLRDGMAVVGLGLVIGLGASVGLGKVVQSLLYNTSSRDPETLAVIVLLLFGVSFIACLLPARRATKVDPIVALRAE